VDVFRWGRERARTGAWRGDRQVAHLSPLPDGPALSVDFVRRCLDHLAARGFSRVVTSALSPDEQRSFLAAGFGVEEQLHLLAHDLRHLPRASTAATLRRGRTGDRPGVLAVDHASFQPFWRLDEAGLDDALRATPRARFRVAELAGEVIGYAITGRSGQRGYLQRLGVHPGHRHAGTGSALVVDGLAWLRRWRADMAVVNTQNGNTGALHVYEGLGFRRLPHGLSVLSTGLGDHP
jgi:ribosomal protein S18 acetylase RimI-like enzyme